jgi:hypothetical protein
MVCRGESKEREMGVVEDIRNQAVNCINVRAWNKTNNGEKQRWY